MDDFLRTFIHESDRMMFTLIRINRKACKDSQAAVFALRKLRNKNRSPHDAIGNAIRSAATWRGKEDRIRIAKRRIRENLSAARADSGVNWA